jgi:hypothetical protein
MRDFLRIDCMLLIIFIELLMDDLAVLLMDFEIHENYG